MRRRGPQKHSNAKIASAIMKYEAGTPLSQIAQAEGVAKSLVKYWVDHADKFLPATVQSKRAPAISKLLKRGELLGWRKFIQLISLDRKSIDAMDGAKRIEAAAKLKDILMGIGGRTGQGPDLPEEVIEISEKKARLIVKNWSQKQPNSGLEGGGVERAPASEAGAAPIDAEPDKPEAKSAT